MKIFIQKTGLLYTFFLFVTVLAWTVVWTIQGLPGAYSWFALKMVLPFLGLIGMVYQVVTIPFFMKKRKSTAKKCYGLAVYVIWAAHLLLTMNTIALAYPASVKNTAPSVAVAWPFAEEAVVGWGGNSVSDNLPHAIWPSERWAYDLVMEPYQSGSSRAEDYGIWEREVLSPAAGTVIAVYNEEPDLTPGMENFQTMEGNHVYLELEETGTYLLLNHFKQGSITVKAGDRVHPGDALGRVGNSGSTSEPHLHIHHQRQDPRKTLLPILAEGLPLYFTGTDAKPMPEKGTTVKPQ
jgi:hypothetical protein